MNPLNELLELANQKEELEYKMRKLVVEARNEGHSWQTIANKIGGTKQAAQQKYGKAVTAAEEQAKWRAANPEAAAAARARGEAEAARVLAEIDAKLDAKYGDQLEGQTAIFIDAEVPAPAAEDDIEAKLAAAHATADRILAAEAAAKAAKKAAKSITTPHRTDAPQADKDADDTMDRIESGELDTEGFTIDWNAEKLKNGICPKCSMTHHYEGKGRNLYFWIGPECNPTHRDTTQHR
jgi:hypothetical protein